MKLTILALLGCWMATLTLVASVPARQKRQMDDASAQKCFQACPADVGCTINENGEAQCHFATPCESGLGPCPSTESSRKKRDDDDDAATKCRTACPADTGCRIKDNGEAECIYRSACESGLGPCETPTPPHHRSERSPDDMTPEQRQYCAINCVDRGCVVNDEGNAECQDSDFIPFETPSPPRRNRDTEMTPEQRNFCINNCQDVGCVVNDEGKAECDYSGPSIGAEEPPSPPRNRRDEEMTPEQRNFCIRNCQDVGCVVNGEGKAECDYSGPSIGAQEPPSPPRNRRNEMTPEQRNYCMNNCLDVGCVVNDEGKAECDYSGPSIAVQETPRPPTN